MRLWPIPIKYGPYEGSERDFPGRGQKLGGGQEQFDWFETTSQRFIDHGFKSAPLAERCLETILNSDFHCFGRPLEWSGLRFQKKRTSSELNNDDMEVVISGSKTSKKLDAHQARFGALGNLHDVMLRGIEIHFQG
jgi:hypothetical protein